MPDNTIDGTPDAVKVVCPVWSGGKSGDYFKGLPITIHLYSKCQHDGWRRRNRG